MKEDNMESTAYDGGGLKGPLYWLAGVATAAVAGQNGLLGGILGGPRPPVPGGPDAPVSERILALTAENERLKADAHADQMNAQQSVWNAVQQGRIDCIQRQVDQLFGMTRLTIPNGNLTPGVGPVAVVPVPPPAANPPTVTLASDSVAALANALKAAA